MLTMECGPNGSFSIGEERDVSQLQRDALVNGGYAVDVGVVAVADAQVIETATARNGKQAAKR